MSLYKRFFKQPRVAVCVAIIVFGALLASAKTPALNTNPAAAGEPVFNLSDFDPVGDGVADDGPALQRALNAVAEAGGGTLLIPAGRYRIATPVVKDFSSVNGGHVNIQGVPSSKMPAPVTAEGEQLAAGLDLTSEIIPATGSIETAITLNNLNQLTFEHIAFTGTETSFTDAFITLYLNDIDRATIRHCEFYGISTFGVITELGGGNVIRAVRSELSIELTVFLGSTANSGAYAPIVENLEWKRFSISNSIFLDYGTRSFYGKTGLGAPLSWIGIEHPAPATPESPRREAIVRDTFLDEGGWVGISVLPHRWAWPGIPGPIDLLYISGLKMNVCNMGMTGHYIFDVRNVFIENSHYGWSINAYAAIDLNRVENAILDKLTLIDHADRIHADDRTERLTVINSVYNTVDSQAAITTLLKTEPDADPVQYVRKQFSAILGRPPDPAAHFYWSDLLIRCESNNDCLNEKRSALNQYLSNNPPENFALAGVVTDENGDPLPGVDVKLTGSQTVNVLTDPQGKFRFSNLPTSGSYSVTVNKHHYTFGTSSQTFINPATDVNAVFQARVNRHAISGRIVKTNGAGVSGVTVELAQSPDITATTDENGFYSFPELAAGKTYTVVPSLEDFSFDPVSTTFEDLSEDRVTNFAGTLMMFSFTGTVSDEEGNLLSEVTVNLTGSKSASTLTDSQGAFQFSDLPTSGNYTVEVDKRHYTFADDSHSVSKPDDDVAVVFSARLNRYAITGRITRADGSAFGGVVVQLAQSPEITATTDTNGVYSFKELAAGEMYTVVPAANDFVFAPLVTIFDDLSTDRTANFVGKLQPELITIESSELAVALDSVAFTMQPFSIFNSLGLSNDGFIRVMLFAKNFEPAITKSQVSVVAKDDQGQTYPVEIEFMGEIPGQSWLKQLNVKLAASAVGGKCLQMTLSTGDVSSNAGRICFAK